MHCKLKQLKMKNTEILKSENEEVIDWSKPMWVISDDNMLILTNGKQGIESFSGACLPCKTYKNGEFSEEWSKNMFKPLKGSLTIVISN